MMDRREILMNEKPAKDFILSNFNREINLLNSLKEYGIALFIRCLASLDGNRYFKYRTFVVIHILFRNVLSLLDGITVLIPAGALFCSFLPLRSIFEVTLFIEWILKDSSEEKAKCYYVWNLRNQISIAQRLVSGTAAHEQFSSFISSLTEDDWHLKYLSNEDDVKQEIDRINKELNSDNLKKINSQFEEYEIKHPNRKPNWYGIARKDNKGIWGIADDLKRTEEYLFIYKEQSNIAHSAMMDYNIHIKSKGKVQIEPIRQPGLLPEVMTYTISYVLNMYKMIINEYRSEEMTTFRKKYNQEWKDIYLNIPSVKSEAIDMPLTNI